MGPVRVEDFRLHCMRIIWHLKEARDWEIDFILSPTRFFLLTSKETRPGLTKPITSWGKREICTDIKGTCLGTERETIAGVCRRLGAALLWDSDHMPFCKSCGQGPRWKATCPLQAAWKDAENTFVWIYRCVRLDGYSHVCSLGGLSWFWRRPAMV